MEENRPILRDAPAARAPAGFIPVNSRGDWLCRPASAPTMLTRPEAK
jgi:hypothetical protein